MKKIILSSVFIGFIFVNFVRGQLIVADSVYIYDMDGVKDWYKVQKDVFCFSFTDNSKYTGQLPPCVDTIIYYSNSYSQFNEVHFKGSYGTSSRMSFVDYITSLNEFKTLAYALSKTTSSYVHREFFQTDDVLMITFNNPSLSSGEISTFADKYELEMVYAPDPSLPSGVSWAYSFKMKKSLKDKYRTSVGLAKTLNEHEVSLVKYADPDTYTVKPLSCDPVDEMSSFYQSINGSWFLHNDGGTIWQGKSGTAGADAHICDCWGEGATGQGIKIGVIDHYGFQLSHPDFVNANIPHAINMITSPPTIVTDFLFDNELSSHSMQVTGVIAAQPDNLTATDGYAVGGAYDATVIPYLCGIPRPFTSNVNREPIKNAIQRSATDNCDVLNISLSIGTPGMLPSQLYNATIGGRPDPNNPNLKRGMVVVAGTGNDNRQLGTISTQNVVTFPANQNYTIGVGWSNPDDYRASPNSPGGAWGLTTTGSDYGNSTLNFDVVAPGIIIRTTDLINSSSNGYKVERGASLATPVVSSIAAMILQKRPDLTYQQVKEIIRNGADKVHSIDNGGIYNYNMGQPGFNVEMFYGRVNCFNSLKIAETLDVKENSQIITTIIRDNYDGSFIITTPQNQEQKTVAVYDLSGKLLTEEMINKEAACKVDLSAYEKGMYLLKIYDTKGNSFTAKLMR